MKNFPFDIRNRAHWIAQDSSGVWWGYSVEPLRNNSGWYENEVGDYKDLGSTTTGNWKQSLYKIKQELHINNV